MEEVVGDYTHTGMKVLATFFTDQTELDSLRIVLGEDIPITIEFYGKKAPFDAIVELAQSNGAVVCGPSATRLQVADGKLYLQDTDPWINKVHTPLVICQASKFVDIIVSCLKKQYVGTD